MVRAEFSEISENQTAEKIRGLVNKNYEPKLRTVRAGEALATSNAGS
jgi:hypothetical protein